MTDGDSGDGWAFSESKDWKDGRHRRENEHVLPHAGEITDRDVHDTLTAMEAVYARASRRGWLGADAPASVQGTNEYRDLARGAHTDAFRERVESGAGAKLRQHVGSQADEVDVSGWDDIDRIREIAAERPLMLYIFGNPGTGKTSSALKVARHHVDQYENRTGERVRVITNIRTAVERTERIDGWVRNWGQLKDEVITDEETILAGDPQPTIFIFDEASSHASGGGEDGWDTSTKLAVLLYKIRKYGGSIIIIGHDGKDLHPAVREMCTVLHKTSKEKARFYEAVKNRSGKDPLTPTVTGWPDTKWDYNDKDPADWSWREGTGEEAGENGESGISRELAYKEMAIWTVVRERQQDEPLSYAKIAQRRLDGLRSSEWCRGIWKEYERGEHRDVVGRVEELIG